MSRRAPERGRRRSRAQPRARQVLLHRRGERQGRRRRHACEPCSFSWPQGEAPVDGDGRIRAANGARLRASCTPHLVSVDRWQAYAVVAPLGLIPCPTLAAVIGVTLMVGPPASKAWSAVLSVAAIVYGVVGVCQSRCAASGRPRDPDTLRVDLRRAVRHCLSGIFRGNGEFSA